jgi:hypothetical protein
MPYQEVWVDDLELGDCEDDELVDELKSRGFTVYSKDEDVSAPKSTIGELYTTYQTMPPEFFEKELKRFFRENLDVSEY